jgi:c-di-GMP-binding flagellar brake protein YcgR
MKTEKEGKETGSSFGTVNFERRKHPRIAVNLSVEYWKVNETRIRAGCTGDISEGGVLLHLPEQMKVGQELRLRLFVDSGLDFLSIEAHAEVVWKDLNIKNEGGVQGWSKIFRYFGEGYVQFKNLSH